MNIFKHDCMYCGMSAQERDHVVPHSYAQAEGQTRNWHLSKVVPACTECNHLLNNLFHTTIATRALFIAGRLKARYKKLLASPDWNEDELAELGESLRGHVKGEQSKKKLINVRIEYALEISKNTELTPMLYWKNFGYQITENTTEQQLTEEQLVEQYTKDQQYVRY